MVFVRLVLPWKHSKDSKKSSESEKILIHKKGQKKILIKKDFQRWSGRNKYVQINSWQGGW